MQRGNLHRNILCTGALYLLRLKGREQERRFKSRQEEDCPSDKRAKTPAIGQSASILRVYPSSRISMNW